MRVALVHELLTMKGGAEKVLRVFADMFPDAPIYTLLYDERKLGDWFPPERVRTGDLHAVLHRWVPRSLRCNHHLYLRRFPRAVESWDFSGCDLVISSSSAFVHGIITNGAPRHLCYVHSPARYLWDRTHDVLEQAGRGPLGALRRVYLAHIFHRLRMWDAEVAPRPDALVASSKAVQRRIERYWRRESDVIHPPIEDHWLPSDASLCTSPHATQHSAAHPLGGSFLIVSTLARYKRIDLAIHACNRTGSPLTIVGEGPDRRRLQALAGPNVTFVGYCHPQKLAVLYAHARATIVPGEEDFNLVAVESMACGTPVIAYAAGGPLETVVEGTTGTFFREPTADALSAVLQRFDRSAFDPAACRSQARLFSRDAFERKMWAKIRALMSSHSADGQTASGQAGCRAART